MTQCGTLVVLFAVLLALAGPAHALAGSHEHGNDRMKEAELRAAAALDVSLKGTIDNIRNVFEDIENVTLPFIPLIAASGVSLSLSRLHVTGLTDIDLPRPSMLRDLPDLPVPGLDGKLRTLTLTTPALSLLTDYCAGGKVMNLPFVGESSANITLDALNFTLQFRTKLGCVVKNSTQWNVGVHRLIVQFDDINPGQDTGDLVNSMLSTLGDDVFDWLTQELNTNWHETVDTFFVDLINNFNPVCSTTRKELSEDDDLFRFSADDLSHDGTAENWVTNIQHKNNEDITQGLKTVIRELLAGLQNLNHLELGIHNLIESFLKM